MTAIEDLRHLLEERGVEYTEDHGYREFFWDFGEYGRARASAIGTKGLVQMIVTGITPEQAIAATLGPDYEPPIAARWDGDVLVLTMPRDPSSVHVQRAEGQSRNVYSEEATLGSGTCKVVSKPCDMWECECGKAWWHGGAPNYCPNCGAKVVEG